MKNILPVDKNVGNFKNMGKGKLAKSEGVPEKADSYNRGNTVIAAAHACLEGQVSTYRRSQS